MWAASLGGRGRGEVLLPATGASRNDDGDGNLSPVGAGLTREEGGKRRGTLSPVGVTSSAAQGASGSGGRGGATAGGGGGGGGGGARGPRPAAAAKGEMMGGERRRWAAAPPAGAAGAPPPPAASTAEGRSAPTPAAHA